MRKHKVKPDKRIAPYEFQAIDASATRAVYQNAREMPRFELSFVTDLGERVVIEMNPYDAQKLISQMLATQDVIFPRVGYHSGPVAG